VLVLIARASPIRCLVIDGLMVMVIQQRYGPGGAIVLVVDLVVDLAAGLVVA
jgi:hypothetical protein